MKGFPGLARIIDARSLIVCGLSIASTWLCLRFGITANFPLILVATAVVFPLVFSISTAYQRRERVLEDYANIKAYGRALFLAARDWPPEADDSRLAVIRDILGDLLIACRALFTGPLSGMAEHQRVIHRDFGRLSAFVERLRADGLSANECSRCNQYLGHMMVACENITNIYRYRTPRTLRAFTDFFILLLPIVYGPYFAHQALGREPWLAFVMPVLFSLVLVGLGNIQNELENPFDQIGVDDVAIDPAEFLASLGAEADVRAAESSGAAAA